MSDVSQGPGWWQAADLKWYPPELHADYVAPLPPTPKLPPPPTPVQPPVTTKGPSGQRKIWFVLAGLAVLGFAVEAVGVVIGGMTPLVVALVVLWGLVIIGVTIAVRSGRSPAFRILFIAEVLVVVWLAATAGYNLPRLFGNGSSGGVAGSADSSSFCPDFLQLWNGQKGVQSAITAVNSSIVSGSRYGGGGSRPVGWSDSDLQTAAENAKTLAAEAPSDQFKTDFTNIAQTLSAAATGDYTHGAGHEALDVNMSGVDFRCRTQGHP